MNKQESIDFTLRFFANVMRKKAKEISEHIGGSDKRIPPALVSEALSKGNDVALFVLMLHLEHNVAWPEIIREDFLFGAVLIRKLESGSLWLESKIGHEYDVSDVPKLQREALR